MSELTTEVRVEAGAPIDSAVAAAATHIADHTTLLHWRVKRELVERIGLLLAENAVVKAHPWQVAGGEVSRIVQELIHEAEFETSNDSCDGAAVSRLAQLNRLYAALKLAAVPHGTEQWPNTNPPPTPVEAFKTRLNPTAVEVHFSAEDQADAFLASLRAVHEMPCLMCGKPPGDTP